jgi:hypothetical protein
VHGAAGLSIRLADRSPRWPNKLTCARPEITIGGGTGHMTAVTHQFAFGLTFGLAQKNNSRTVTISSGRVLNAGLPLRSRSRQAAPHLAARSELARREAVHAHFQNLGHDLQACRRRPRRRSSASAASPPPAHKVDDNPDVG